MHDCVRTDWGGCVWTTPRGDYWRVEGDQVITDEEGGDPVPGVLPRPGGPESCGLVVEQMQEWHVGDWDCLQGRLKYNFLLTIYR